MSRTESRVNTAPSGLARTRRRFLIVSIAALTVLGTSLGVSFTADTGVTQVTAASTGGALPLIWSANYTTAGGLPVAVTGVGTAGWKYGAGTPSKPTAPVWPTVVAGQAGSVTTAGDIAVVDATDTSATFLLLTVYVTNMKPLSLTYNSYSLPVRIYAPLATAPLNGFSGGSITWDTNPATDSNGINTANTYLTNTQGYETFKLATGAGKYYEVTLDSGGSFYPYQTGAGGATTPAFYITAQRTS